MSLSDYQRKRDFKRTPEPSGERGVAGPTDELRFVIQKHAASHLHYDLRLEMGGMMRSWAVPKGPSLDPKVRRLAMEVEDHPMEYNDFEGTIPQGEYGGGTVMLWDRGTYAPDEIGAGESAEQAALRGYHAGKLSITFHGERLRGSFALVRTDRVEGGIRSKWLLLKHRDAEADSGRDITEEATTSVATGREMEEIAGGKGGKRVWKSNRPKPKLDKVPRTRKKDVAKPDPSSLLPMLARSSTRLPTVGEWVYEPKYDGMRVLAFATPDAVALMTRNGHDKSRQFPEIVAALRQHTETLGHALVLDGEIVALEHGQIARFERLQARMHVQDRARVGRLAEQQPAAFVAFDILLAADEPLIHASWTERRARLERLLEEPSSETLRISETSPDHRPLLKEAKRQGWEGLIAKRTGSRYRPGQRSPDWLKVKLENRQEFVIGGWTEPRSSRMHLGAILLGYYDEEGRLRYAGHTGTGFNRDLLEEMHRRLRRLERKTPPFSERPKTNELAHWTRPAVVVEIKFNEWTREGKLRQPVFVGFRDDKDPREVTREPMAIPDPDDERKPAKRGSSGIGSEPRPEASNDELDTPVARKIRKIAQGSGEGELKLGRDAAIPLTSLGKVFYPESGHRKEDLLVYYARMAKYVLPWMQDRPLVLKRFPNGVAGEAFYQQAAPDNMPAGVRVDTIPIDRKKQRRLLGGNLATLLYTVQLGAISYDPWHSRIGSLDYADYTILDLDPGPGVPFQLVIEVAGYVKEEMDRLGLHGALKTSGSSGLHVYLPLPPETPLEAATLVAQIIATRVVQRQPKVATIQRLTKKRPRGTVYVDYLQNILGKTVAGVYAARAKSRPTVSTPLSWDELMPDLDLGAFTIDTVPARVKKIGDLWATGMAQTNSLDCLMKSESNKQRGRV